MCKASNVAPDPTLVDPSSPSPQGGRTLSPPAKVSKISVSTSCNFFCGVLPSLGHVSGDDGVGGPHHARLEGDFIPANRSSKVKLALDRLSFHDYQIAGCW